MANDIHEYPFESYMHPANARTQSVLIVDDVENNISNASVVLNDTCEVILAQNGLEALRLANKLRPDLILLSTRMRDMDGFEIISQLKSNHYTRAIPIVVMSKAGDEVEETKSFALGAIDYITIPQSASILQARVRIHLRADQQRKTLQHLSQFDGLTGVLNRRIFDDLLMQCWNARKETNRSLSLLFIDVDNFKDINDAFGHLVGDDALRLVAKTITNQIERASDIVARYGGEEFSCLLPNTEVEGAKRLAEKIRIAINRLEVQDPQGRDTKSLSVSIGIASTSSEAYPSYQDFISSADRRLYAAKRSGRNVVVY